MISYLIASYRPEAVKVTLASIKNLPKHDYEVIVVTPRPEANYDNVRYILDDKLCGSTYAFNKGVRYCNGDWIVVGIDDHIVYLNIEHLLKVLYSPAIQNLEYQVINLGSPWKDTLSRNIQSHRLNMGNIPEDVLQVTWPVITFPVVSMKTILTKFEGYLFNPYMEHHFVDHWIGLYTSYFQPKYDHNQYGPHAAWVQHWPGENCDRTRDDTDSLAFCKTAVRFIQNPTKYGYVSPL